MNECPNKYLYRKYLNIEIFVYIFVTLWPRVDRSQSLFLICASGNDSQCQCPDTHSKSLQRDQLRETQNNSCNARSSRRVQSQNSADKNHPMLHMIPKQVDFKCYHYSSKNICCCILFSAEIRMCIRLQFKWYSSLHLK